MQTSSSYKKSYGYVNTIHVGIHIDARTEAGLSISRG